MAQRPEPAQGVLLAEPRQDYFPMAIGNTWSYQPAETSPGYETKEYYRVAANEGDKWYLEHYGYVLGPDAA